MAIATTSNDSVRGDGRLESKGAVLWALRAAAVLTTSYVASSHMDSRGAPKVGIWIALDSVDYTSIEYAVEGSHDASTWFQIDVTPTFDSPKAILFSVEGDGEGEIMMDVLLDGATDYFASIEAFDESGLATPVEVIGFRTGASDADGRPGERLDDPDPATCGCNGSGREAAIWLGMLAVGALRRRRGGRWVTGPGPGSGAS